MDNELIAVISIVEDPLGEKVKELWQTFENQYNTKGVQIFKYPSVTLAGGSISPDKLKILKENFQRFGTKVKPWILSVEKYDHVEQDSIYMKVERQQEILAVNILVNSFLEIFCDELIEDYKPENFRPHIALAMNDLEDEQFDRAWKVYAAEKCNYQQQINNIILVKFEEDGHLEMIARAKLGEKEG
ncbi:MAG: hypothetical protein PF689_09840 [Deltaproteobacteria bacterium]|jgi:2'-5' RNA ligase|nr:hypothetical protein [Deltaproteobacteria bacterium]